MSGTWVGWDTWLWSLCCTGSAPSGDLWGVSCEEIMSVEIPHYPEIQNIKYISQTYLFTDILEYVQVHRSLQAPQLPDLAHFLEALLQADGLLLMGGDSVDLLCQRVHHLGRGFWGVHGETHHPWQVLWACHPVVYHHCVVTRVCSTDTLEC